MDRTYISKLNDAYDDFFENRLNGSSVLIIDTNELNYIAKPEDLKSVEIRIRQTLKLSPFQSELPLDFERVN